MDPSLLLPREKYEKAQTEYGHSSITLKIANDHQSLFYFGANHSRDPLDPQYSALRDYWARFLKVTQGKDRIVLVEGGLRRILRDEESAIISGSEGSFITLLAHKAGVSVACPDISDEELVGRLPNLNKEEVLLYWFLSWVNNFQRHTNPKPDFEKSAQMWCEDQKQRTMWAGLDFSLETFRGLYKKILNKEFNKNEDPNDFVNPNKNGTPTNAIARAQSDLRDANIASEIERYWGEGKSIFVVFGKGHLIIEEPALKAVLK